jgi:hypothetical protein
MVGSNGTTQVQTGVGTIQIKTEGSNLVYTGNSTYPNATVVSGTLGLPQIAGGTFSMVAGGTLSLEGLNVVTRVLISGGTIQTNLGGLGLTVTGITLSQGDATVILANPGAINVTGGTVFTILDKQIQPAPTGLVP